MNNTQPQEVLTDDDYPIATELEGDDDLDISTIQ